MEPVQTRAPVPGTVAAARYVLKPHLLKLLKKLMEERGLRKLGSNFLAGGSGSQEHLRAFVPILR